MNKIPAYILTAAAFILFGISMAAFFSSRGSAGRSTRTDTSYTRYVDCVRSYQPRPVMVIYQAPAPGSVKIDTPATVTDYQAQRIYADTQAVKFGRIFINDTISKNRIQGRGIRTDFTLPTVTKTAYQQPKRKFFLGADIYANPGSLLQGAGPVISMQNKRDQIFEAGAYFNNTGQTTYRVGFRAKIHL